MVSGKTNVFTKGCDKFKKDALTKHAHTVDHRAAIEAKAGMSDMQQALTHVYKDQELAVVAALKTVYFMAKKNLHFSDLKHFLVLQGISFSKFGYNILLAWVTPFSIQVHKDSYVCICAYTCRYVCNIICMFFAFITSHLIFLF